MKTFFGSLHLEGLAITMLTNFTLGLIFSAIMGFGGYYKKALSKSGVVGALILGTAIFGSGGWRWGAILVAFFVASTALSFFKKTEKRSVAEKFDKGSRRDIGQAFANGGLGAIIAVASLLWPSPLWWVAFLGTFGTTNADTWATELGVLSKATPRMITTGMSVAPGTSGGITLGGTLAALSGGLLIGAVAWLIGDHLSTLGATIILVAGLGGLAGALCDSLLGATLQRLYYCDNCQRETERQLCCGHPTRPIRGLRWLNNDWVNFLSSGVGATVAVVISLLI